MLIGEPWRDIIIAYPLNIGSHLAHACLNYVHLKIINWFVSGLECYQCTNIEIQSGGIPGLDGKSDASCAAPTPFNQPKSVTCANPDDQCGLVEGQFSVNYLGKWSLLKISVEDRTKILRSSTNKNVQFAHAIPL